MQALNQNKSYDWKIPKKTKRHSFLKVFFAICLSLFIFAWAVFTIDPNLFILDVAVTQANYSHTTLIVMDGEVYVNGKIVTQSQILEVWDIVETGSGAQALIDFFDNSVTRLKEKTNLEITEMDVNPENQMETNILLKLNAGEVWNKVTKIVTQDSSFEVETYNTIAAVRGSAFNIKVDEESQATEVIVAEHAVDLSAKNETSGEVIGTTQVLEGFKTRVKKQVESDRDHDGIFDDDESLFGTDPDNPDTDGDGFLDGDEVNSGYNPNGEGSLDGTQKEQIKITSTGSNLIETVSEGVFETRELLESEKDSEWLKDNELLDEQHLEKVKQQEELYKQEAAGMLPDNPLYALKNIKDQIVLGTSGDDFRKLLAELEIASRKMIEASILFEQNKEEAAVKLVQGFKNTVKSVWLEVDQYGLTIEEEDKIKNKIGEILDYHQRLLSNVLPDSDMYELKELMYELEIESTLNFEEKVEKEGEYQKQFATDILDLTKSTEDTEVINQVLENYQVRFEGNQLHGSANVSDALIASAEWLLVEMAREDVVDELSSSEQVQQDAGEKLRILAEEKRVEEEEARREAEIQEQLQAELAQQQAEAEAARLRAEKLENARLAKEKVEEAKRLEAEKQAAEAARVAAEAEADRAEAERMSLEAEAETTSEPVEQVVETKRACTNSSTDWALGEWGSCDLGTLLKTRSIIHVSDCDRDAAGAYIPDDETPCNPCDDIDLKAVCEGTTYKSRPTCNSTTGVITYGTITENSDKCDYVAVLDCVESDWTTGTWSVCNNSGISTREVTKKTNVTCNGFAAKPSDQYSCVNNEIGTGLSYAEINCVDQGTRYQNSEGVWSDYYGEIYNNNSKSCSIDANTSGTQTCNDGDYGGCNALGTCEAELHWNDAENKCDSNSITQTCTNSTKPSTNSIWTAPSGVNNADGSYESIWTGSTYSPSNSDCQWSCENNYALEDGVCINQKTVNCDSSNTPNNAQASIASVEINYTDADGWSAPAECSFVCDSAYSRDENSCKQNPPAILNLTNVEWSSNDLSLTFADVAGADSYKLCDWTSTDGNPTITSKKFIPTETKTYGVAACNDGGCGECSEEKFTVVKSSSADDIQNALSSASWINDNDQKTIFIASGTYTGNNYINLESNVHLLGSAGSKPKIKTGFVIDGKSNVTIENLKVENESVTRSNEVWSKPAQIPMGVFVKWGASNITIKNNEFNIGSSISQYPYAIFNNGSIINLIDGNIINSSNTYVGIANVNAATIETISWNEINLTGDSSYGIYNYSKNWNSTINNIVSNISIVGTEKGIRNNAYSPYTSKINNFSGLDNVTKCSGNQNGNYFTNGEDWGGCH